MICHPPLPFHIVSGVQHGLCVFAMIDRRTYRSQQRFNQPPRRRHPLVRSPLPKEAPGYMLTK
jgi:hypothetical protein